MNKFKRKASAIIIFIILVTFLIPLGLNAVTNLNDSKTVIKLSASSNKILVNETEIKAEKPYVSSNILYIPLRAVLESFGAEVNWLGTGKINIIFRDASVDLTVGKVIFYKNQTEMTLTAPPKMKNNSIMIPVEFIKQCFDIDITNGTKPDQTILTLNNDGALTDLSFLIASLNNAKVGNSYFGWSMSVPKGSRIVSETFNSKNVQIENEQQSISIDITIDTKDGKTIDKYYNEIKDNPYEVLKSNLIDSSLNLKAIPAYIELLYTNMYDEAVYRRIYADDKYFYNITITSFDKSNPNKLKNDKYLKDMMNSFRLGYKGDVSDTTDLSKVQYGLSKYENYITSDATGKKYYTWEMSILPEWDVLQTDGMEPYITEIGINKKDFKEKISIEVTNAKGETDVVKYGKMIESFYNSNLNPQLYKLNKADVSQFAGIKTYNMVYDVKLGKTQYRYDESFLISGGLVYDITFKSNVDSFEKKKESYKKMLETFKSSSKDNSIFITEMDKYTFNLDKNRIGKDDKPVLYENKTIGWNITIPGYWQKSSTPGQNCESFNNPKTGAIIRVESLVKKAGAAIKADEERFESMKSNIGLEFKLVNMESIQKKGQTLKVYKYRYEDNKIEIFADFYYYIYESELYSYCIMSAIPDISSSAGNLKSMNDIYDSFVIVEKALDK